MRDDAGARTKHTHSIISSWAASRNFKVELYCWARFGYSEYKLVCLNEILQSQEAFLEATFIFSSK